MSSIPETAETIRQQITLGVLMSLGAHNLELHTDDSDQPALMFTARVLPFNVNGTRLQQPRNMRVLVTLTAADTYDISVDYHRGTTIVRHFAAAGVYADQLPPVLLSLDSDDDLQHAHIHHENRVTG